MFKTSPGSHPERAPAITPSLSLFYSHEYTKVTCQKGPLCLSLILFFKGSSQSLTHHHSFFLFLFSLTYPYTWHSTLLPTFPYFFPCSPRLPYTHLSLIPTRHHLSLFFPLFSLFLFQPISLSRKSSTETISEMGLTTAASRH